MDVEGIISDLQSRYQGMPIIVRPADAPTEIICEFMRGEKRSAAVVVIESSTAHYYKTTTVGISVSRGEIYLHIDGQRRSLKTTETEVIQPQQIRYVEARGGEPAWLIVVYTPPWLEEDQIQVVSETPA